MVTSSLQQVLDLCGLHFCETLVAALSALSAPGSHLSLHLPSLKLKGANKGSVLHSTDATQTPFQFKEKCPAMGPSSQGRRNPGLPSYSFLESS